MRSGLASPANHEGEVIFEADSAPRESEGIREVLGSLDAATKEFTRRLEELAALGSTPARSNGASPDPGEHGAVAVREDEAQAPEPAAAQPGPTSQPEAAATPQPEAAATPHSEAAATPRPEAAPPEPAPAAAQSQPAPPPPPTAGFGGVTITRTQHDLERRMADADAEAARYLEQAKRRADAMVQSIVGAVEAEAEAMRRDAEQRIRARWRQVEADAARFLDDARRAADGLVDERRRRISELSDTIVGLAETLTERMTDADRIRRQFDSLVVTLSETAGRLATDPATVAEPRAVPASEMWWRSRTGGLGVEPAAQARAA